MRLRNETLSFAPAASSLPRPAEAFGEGGNGGDCGDFGGRAVSLCEAWYMVSLYAKVEAAAPQQASKQVGKIELLAGKRVKLQYQDVDVRGLIRAMGEAASVNILVSDKVSGTVTVKLAEMPWDQALDIILNSQGLVKREKDGILFIEPASA